MPANTTYSLRTQSEAADDRQAFSGPNLDADNVPLCCYHNRTASIQVIRIPDLPNQHFERVVFPSQHLMFYAPPHARLEVYAGGQAGALLADTLTCDRIQVPTH